MTSVSAAIAGVPVSGRARISVASFMTSGPPSRAIESLCRIPVRHRATRGSARSLSRCAPSARPERPDMPDRLLLVLFGRRRPAWACSATRVSSRKLTSRFQNLQDFQHDRWRQTAGRLGTGSGAALGRDRPGLRPSGRACRTSIRPGRCEMPFSLRRSSPSCRRLPMASYSRISSSTALNFMNLRRSKKACMSSMMAETRLALLPFLARPSRRALCEAPSSTSEGATPKASATWSLIRPAILYCCREAALSRLTSVLPSRLARTRLSSSAILSNSASRSCCSSTASSTFCPAGQALGFAAAPHERRHGEREPGFTAARRGWLFFFSLLRFGEGLLRRFAVDDLRHGRFGFVLILVRFASRCRYAYRGPLPAIGVFCEL